jgi:hypothetical protein
MRFVTKTEFAQLLETLDQAAEDASPQSKSGSVGNHLRTASRASKSLGTIAERIEREAAASKRRRVTS